MTRKNLMEERQLNFNRPLLSVRRGTSTTAPPVINKTKSKDSRPSLPPLPFYKSDLKSGPIRDPGVIPFQWEQTPGRPKGDNKPRSDVVEKQPLAPKLPPGRIVNNFPKSTDRELNDSPVSSSRSQPETVPSSLELSAVDKALAELEVSEKGKEDKDISSSDDENVNYVDARDTLSRTDSSLYNCSVSGVSGLEGQNVKPSSGFSDPQSRDFMMGRFLPAAKAVASETPHCASKKYPVGRQQQKPVKDVVTRTWQYPQYKSNPDSLRNNLHREEKVEEEDDEDGYNSPAELQAKLCGLLPRFCLLNPIPGMRDHAQVNSSVQSVRTRPSYDGVYRKNGSKVRTDNHRGDHLNRTNAQHTSTNISAMNGHYSRSVNTQYKKGSPQFLFGKQRGFIGLPDLKAGGGDLREKKSMIGTADPAVEKTLYIDSEQMVEFQDSNSSSSESRGRNPSVDYSLQEFKALCDADEKTVAHAKRSEKVDSSVLSTSESSGQGVEGETLKDFKHDRKHNAAFDVQQLPKPDKKDSTGKSSAQVVLAPLLLRSPSESWLSRTLPSMTSKHPPNSYVGNMAFNASPLDPKRERMLRSSAVQHSLFRPPEVLRSPLQPSKVLAPILES